MKYVLVLLAFTTNLLAAPILPDKTLTPGNVYTTDWSIACAAHTGNEDDSIRKVTTKTKKLVYKSYGLTGNHTGYCNETKRGCELDHLISLKLGGSDEPSNLWPQSYGGEWSATKKDNLEKTLIARVCRTSTLHPKRLPLEEAQKAIASNWVEAYKKYVVDKQ